MIQLNSQGLRFVGLFTFLLFSSNFVFSQDNNCNGFKVGKYINFENELVKSRIERTTNFQFEEFGEKKIKLKIEWIDECSYILVFINGNKAFWKDKSKSWIPRNLIVKISILNANSYIQESKFVGDDEFKYVSTILRDEIK